jgi:hypothetical protein
MFLDGRPLRDNPLDARYFVDRGSVLDRLKRTVDGRYNALLLGDRGSGKTSTLAQLAFRLREAERPVVFVDASLAADPRAVVEFIRRELGLAPTISQAWREMFRQAFVPAPNLSVDSQLVEAVRALAPAAEGPAAEPVPILLDGLTNAQNAYTLFGRLRDELWRLPYTWVVSGEPSQEPQLLAAPADAFFDIVVRLEPLSLEEAQRLIMLRLDGDPFDVNGLVGAVTETPRQLLGAARAVALDQRSPDEVLDERRELEKRRLGRAEQMAFSELAALGRPVSASDEDFLQRMGWTRPRAVKVLKDLEALRLVRSTTAPSPGSGRPKVVYVPSTEIVPAGSFLLTAAQEVEDDLETLRRRIANAIPDGAYWRDLLARGAFEENRRVLMLRPEVFKPVSDSYRWFHELNQDVPLGAPIPLDQIQPLRDGIDQVAHASGALRALITELSHAGDRDSG